MNGKLISTLFVVCLGSLLMAACGGGTKYVEQEPIVPEPEPIVEPEPLPEPVPEPEIEMLMLETIYFDYDRSDIRADQRSILAENGNALEGRPEATVMVEGHCDDRGTNEYNMALGQRRAESVKRYLVNYGVDPAKVTTVSYGEERPVDYGHDEAAWARNRRSEFVVQQ